MSLRFFILPVGIGPNDKRTAILIGYPLDTNPPHVKMWDAMTLGVIRDIKLQLNFHFGFTSNKFSKVLHVLF